jgi:hypothetical protein
MVGAVNNVELERMQKEAIVAYLKSLSVNSTYETDEKKKN